METGERSRAGASGPTAGSRVHSANSSGGSDERDARLHKAAFHGDVSEVDDLLAQAEVNPSAPDKHGRRGGKGLFTIILLLLGNTALHIAVMLGHKGETLSDSVESFAPTLFIKPCLAPPLQ